MAKGLAQRHGSQADAGGAAQKSTLAVLQRLLGGWQAVTYQLDGPKMKQRIGYFDRALIPDPHAWLTSRLGPLAAFMEGGPELGDALLIDE